MKVTYSANNSGGSWWLTDQNWDDLVAAGWVPDDVEKTHLGKDGRYLGAKYKSATLQCETPGDAMRLFEKVTGQLVTVEGCNCCGAPHEFRWGSYDDNSYGYAEGHSCFEHLELSDSEELARRRNE